MSGACEVCWEHTLDCKCKEKEKMRSRFQVKNPLTLDERIKIKEGLDSNQSYREIALEISRAKSTVIKEARRLGDTSQYDPHKAQINFEYIQEMKRKKHG